MNKLTFTAIQDWMYDLGLDLYGTVAYAVVFGFSQDGESTFKGSLAYLGRKMMCSRSKVIRTLKDMVEKGLLQKIEITRNGVKFCEYRAIVPYTGSVCETPGGSVCETPNNIDKENIDKEYNIDCRTDLLFGEELKRLLENQQPFDDSPKKHEATPRENFEQRVEKFKEKCYSFEAEFGKKLVDDFFYYWSETKEGGHKMRWEKESTFDVHRRMCRWKNNNFGNRYGDTEPERKCISVDEALARAYGNH